MGDRLAHDEWAPAVQAYKAAHPDIDWDIYIPVYRTLPDGGWEVVHHPYPATPVEGARESCRDVRPWSELRASGLLWLINSTVFHPRGFALAFTMKDGEPVGWKLLGDGSEPWRFDGDIDELFLKAEETLAAHRIEVER